MNNKTALWVGLAAVVIVAIGAWVSLTKAPAPSVVADNSQPAPAVETPATPTPPDTTAPTPSTPSTPAAPAPATDTSGVKEFTVTGGNFFFSPSTLSVKKGDQVKITFVNSGGFHDFRIDELNVATKRIQGGAQDVVEFTADKTGTFEYYCSVGEHRAMGMKGTLTVTE